VQKEACKLYHRRLGFVVAALLGAAAQRLDPAYVGPTFYALSGFHGAFIALLAGSIASAEERHLGTLASQVLLPRAAWRQWFVKVGVTLGLSAALAVGLPALLMSILRPVDPFHVQDEFVVAILLVTSGALYVSTLCSNSLWALLATLPVLGGAFVLAAGIFDALNRAQREWVPIDHARLRDALRAEFATNPDGYRVRWEATQSVEHIVPIVLGAGLSCLVLYFAARNHRSLERSIRTVANQASGFILYFIGATVLFIVMARTRGRRAGSGREGPA
jgi:hypothetical protein